MRKKIKTLVYPFDDECEAFLEFHSWMEYIDIIAVDTPCGWGNMNFIEEGNIQQIGSNIKGIELLWIVESTNKITLNEFEKRLIFLTKDIKNILVSRKLSAEEFDKLEEIAKINSVKIIEEKDIIGTLSEQSFEESGEGYALKDIEIPIVMIAGAGENCNKFELELLIANKLKEIGYKVSIVTSRSHVNCLGVHSFPTFMFQSLKDENEKIIAYNNYIKYLSEIDKPDIFVLGVPGGILPITRRQPEHFGIFAFEVFNSVKPDYMIFNLYNADVERKYLSEMKMLMKYRFDVDIDAFYISNYIQDGLSLNTFMPIKYIRQEQQDVEEKWEKFGEGNYYKSKITLLVENLIQTLNGYKEIEIL